jgi:hypothetical protein
MVAPGVHGIHPCTPETLVADNRSVDVRLVVMRRALPGRDSATIMRTDVTFRSSSLNLAGHLYTPDSDLAVQWPAYTMNLTAPTDEVATVA